MAADIFRLIAENAKLLAEQEISALPDELLPKSALESDLSLAPLVRLDVAVLACHLLAAHFALRATAAAWLEPVTKTDAALDATERLFIGQVLKRGLGQMFGVPLAMVSSVNATKLAATMKEALSDSAAQLRAQLKRFFLGNGKKPRARKTRRVWTRHIQPRQRKPYASWHNQSPS